MARNIWRFAKYFLPLHPLIARMSNGVMVAQQVLVLFVVVRIRLGQRKKSDLNRGHSFCVVLLV